MTRGRSAGGRARGVLRIWTLVEWFEGRRTGLQPVQPGGLLAYSIRRQRGGSAVLEIHLNNDGMLRAAAESPWRRLDRAKSELRILALLVAEGRLGPVQALRGTSLLGAAGRRAGFEVRQMPATWRWGLERLFLVGMDVIYHPDGTRRLRRAGALRWPAELSMTRAEFLRRYGPGSP